MQPRGMTIGRVAAALAAAALTAAAGTGRIVFEADGGERVTSVRALDRASGAPRPGARDPVSGRFVVDGLAAGVDYDLVIDFAGGRLEGIGLNVPPPEDVEDGILTPEDREIIRGKVASMNRFEDEVQVLAVSGNGRHAAALVHKLRTRPFYASKPGEVIWRAERWRFERPEETWVKVQDEMATLLHRERMPRSAYDRLAVTFDPALGGLRVGPGGALDLGRVDLPADGPGVRVRGAPAEEESQP